MVESDDNELAVLTDVLVNLPFTQPMSAHFALMVKSAERSMGAKYISTYRNNYRSYRKESTVGLVEALAKVEEYNEYDDGAIFDCVVSVMPQYKEESGPPNRAGFIAYAVEAETDRLSQTLSSWKARSPTLFKEAMQTIVYHAIRSVIVNEKDTEMYKLRMAQFRTHSEPNKIETIATFLKSAALRRCSRV